jgi:hypothetical protein
MYQMSYLRKATPMDIARKSIYTKQTIVKVSMSIYECVTTAMESRQSMTM